ncbi:hypothetical protein DRO56_03405 [Candidatus Bathyarchaeota archaeon]|nr:MAG: hypothetical protein DRO56_03405 [Candidatus Bathyarchaeota archaeon]
MTRWPLFSRRRTWRTDAQWMEEDEDLMLDGSLINFSFESLKVMPNSTIFILLLSAAINFVVNLANRMAIDIEEYRDWLIRSTQLRRELMKAIQSGNKRLVDRIKREQQKMMGVQSKINMQRMKLTLFFFIPILVLWRVLGPFYGKEPVALMPFEAPFLGEQLTLFWWYFLSSLATNVLISRLLGLTFEV